jgi:hypothetical protein
VAAGGFQHFVIAVAWRYTGPMPVKPQFSLRVMFVAVAVAALIAAEAVALPGWLAFAAGILVTSFLPPVLIAGVFYARGFARAFCIGALAWLLAAHWIAKISLGVPTTQGIELIGSSAGTGMPGMMSSPPGILSQPNAPYFEQLGLMYRSGYCAMWLLTIAGGMAALVSERKGPGVGIIRVEAAIRRSADVPGSH